MSCPASVFASAFDNGFKQLTNGLRIKGLSHNEIPLFRAVSSALMLAGNNTYVEEYHGNKHQVEFANTQLYVRNNAKDSRQFVPCELSDLMVIIYSPSSKNIRLTYIQAKSEQATLTSVCGRTFKADLRQWFLLSKRPAIKGVGKFVVPSDLLSNALLPSVGSFIFFYKDANTQHFETFFAVADCLVPPHSYTQKNGSLQAMGTSMTINNNGHKECRAVCGSYAFAESIYSLEIGTPIHSGIIQALPVRNWLAGVLKMNIQVAQQENRRTVLAREVIELLSPTNEQNSSGFFGAKKLLIIKSDTQTDKLPS